MNHIAQNENDDFSVVLATQIAIYTKENARLKKEIAAKRSRNAELKARISAYIEESAALKVAIPVVEQTL